MLFHSKWQLAPKNKYYEVGVEERGGGVKRPKLMHIFILILTKFCTTIFFSRQIWIIRFRIVSQEKKTQILENYSKRTILHSSLPSLLSQLSKNHQTSRLEKLLMESKIKYLIFSQNYAQFFEEFCPFNKSILPNHLIERKNPLDIFSFSKSQS